MYILGISAFYHDSSACLIKNSEILTAVQEERFTRKKFDASFPINSILFCLEQNKINLNDIEAVVFYEKPFLKFERLIKTYIDFFPRGFNSFKAAMPIWSKEKLYQKKIINDYLSKISKKKFDKNKIKFSEHHLSHAASAFFPSPFDESAIVVMDGVGEFVTTTIAKGHGNQIEILSEINFPDSLGLLYSAFTYFLGFKVNSDEYKVMGLAPYGDPKYSKLIRENLIDIKEDGSFKLNQDFFSYATDLVMTSPKFAELFKISKRNKNEEILPIHKNIAASIQEVSEEVIKKISITAKKITNSDNLCLAGGVALNCVANGKIYQDKIFDNIWIQPAAGDAGGSLGAALAYYYSKNLKRNIDETDSMKNSYLGPNYLVSDIEKELNHHTDKINFKYYDNDKEFYKIVIENILKEYCIGWFQGKMEYGPRALGNRSIIADPRPKNMQSKINLKIKFREGFRPFAPMILESEVNKWFNYKDHSKYMLMVSSIRNEIKINKNENFDKSIKNINSIIPATTHVDGSARIQTINKSNGRIYELLNEFFLMTKCPILVNTSFNLSDEPIVCSPKDAIKSFLNCNMEILVIDKYIIKKT